MKNVAVVSEASLKEGCLYFDRIIPVFDVVRSEVAMRLLEYLKWNNRSPRFTEDALLTVLMHDVDPTLDPEIIGQIMPPDASKYMAPLIKPVLEGMQAAHVRWSFDQKRPENMVTFKDGKTLRLPLEEAIERMESIRTLFKHDTPEEYVREHEETIESEIASLVKRYKLPFVTDSDNSIISRKEGSEDPIISVMNLNLIETESISWEHILELKQDEESCKKLRRFRTFIRDNYEGKSKSYIEDDVLTRKTDYEETAERLGLNLVKSGFEVVANSKSFLATTSASLVAAVLGQPLISVALCPNAVIELGHIVLEITSSHVEYKRQLANHPVAYIVEARSKVND